MKFFKRIELGSSPSNLLFPAIDNIKVINDNKDQIMTLLERLKAQKQGKFRTF